MSDLTIAEVKRAQEALRIKILEHMLAFHRLTGCFIESISIEHMRTIDDKVVDYIVTVNIQIQPE